MLGFDLKDGDDDDSGDNGLAAPRDWEDETNTEGGDLKNLAI